MAGLPMEVVRGCLSAAIEAKAGDMDPTPGCQAGESRVMHRKGCGKPAAYMYLADFGGCCLCEEHAQGYLAENNPKLMKL